jgi:thiamine biosynthesis lipoprotein
VVLAARDLYLSTQGAFDPTVGPLVDLWGFGPAEKRAEPPTPEEIASATEVIGMDRLVLEETGPAIVKLKAGVHLDLSAIAKGYGVDAVSELLLAQGYTDHMVEIGGEIRVEGFNLKREHWNLGIDSPSQEPGRRNLVHTLHLTGQSVATSGNYRNFFEFGGVRYTHVMDPKSGWPVPDVVKSVTVIAPSCMRADGAATAIMVLGAEKGIAWAESEKDLEALVLSQTPEGEIVETRTPGFEKYIGQ